VFVDVDPETWTLRPRAAGRGTGELPASGRLPKAVVAVDLYGQSSDYDRIHAVCDRYEVPVFADAAEALGATYRGRPAGSSTCLAAFSFNGNKIITTSGGGMLVGARREWIERARHLATQARDPAPHYEHSSVGYNYRLSNLLAAVGRAQLRQLPTRVAARRANRAFYQDAFAGQPGLAFMPEASVRPVERLADLRAARVRRSGVHPTASGCTSRRGTSSRARSGSRCTCSPCSPAAGRAAARWPRACSRAGSVSPAARVSRTPTATASSTRCSRRQDARPWRPDAPPAPWPACARRARTPGRTGPTFVRLRTVWTRLAMPMSHASFRRLQREPGRISMSRTHRYSRRLALVLAHACLAACANLAAFWLRFDGEVPEAYIHRCLELLPFLLLLRASAYGAFGLYTGFWRYTSVGDLRALIAATAASSVAFILLVYVADAQPYPRSILVIDALLSMAAIGGVRMSRRLYLDYRRRRRNRRLLICGAGDAGEMVVRDMRQRGDYAPIGFVDDDPRKVGKRIHGVPVLGRRQDLPWIMSRYAPDEVLVAAPRGGPRMLRSLVEALEPYKVPIKTLPHLHDILDGVVTMNQVRELSIEDLLPRSAVDLDRAPLERLIAGKRVLVTGAGGSIGSELCRQIAALAPASLVLFERYENSLYTILHDLHDNGAPTVVVPVVGDVTDRQRLDDVFATHRPQIVFHAAAHKHVPLMELNPCEAVKNNVGGTRQVAEAATRHRVERFVMISTDKAVNPRNVMGATKRVAEMVVQAMARRTSTRFVAVRFGNVLGSNGSVVPRFLSQIRAGGPVTVTHPEIRRYFMLIPEAVQLVLHAAAMAEGGEIFVLDMGEQIRIADMARHMIRLAGFVPDQDIAIEYTGLRPGEKLYEELVAIRETDEPSDVEKIRRVTASALPDPAALRGTLFDLLRAATESDRERVIAGLRQLVPTFAPGEVDTPGSDAYAAAAGPVSKVA
jgi:FlaA1/EpsC-like NDP-sugar epimerase